eukprot:COSAG03_NODE_12915_length_504_cov_1.009390_2_plen_58_part_00
MMVVMRAGADIDKDEPDAAGIIRYIAQRRAAGHQMTVWDNVGGEDNPIELSDSDDEL